MDNFFALDCIYFLAFCGVIIFIENKFFDSKQKIYVIQNLLVFTMTFSVFSNES